MTNYDIWYKIKSPWIFEEPLEFDSRDLIMNLDVQSSRAPWQIPQFRLAMDILQNIASRCGCGFYEDESNLNTLFQFLILMHQESCGIHIMLINWSALHWWSNKILSSRWNRKYQKLYLIFIRRFNQDSNNRAEIIKLQLVFYTYWYYNRIRLFNCLIFK